jgi:hypothetical protein
MQLFYSYNLQTLKGLIKSICVDFLEKKKPVTRQSPKKEAKEVYRKMEEDLEAMFAGDKQSVA